MTYSQIVCFLMSVLTSEALVLIIWASSLENLSLGASDKVSFKPISSATETS